MFLNSWNTFYFLLYLLSFNLEKYTAIMFEFSLHNFEICTDTCSPISTYIFCYLCENKYFKGTNLFVCVLVCSLYY